MISEEKKYCEECCGTGYLEGDLCTFCGGIGEMIMKYFSCPHCGKQLINVNNFYDCENENEFYCDDCRLTFVLDEDGSFYEECDGSDKICYYNGSGELKHIMNITN